MGPKANKDLSREAVSAMIETIIKRGGTRGLVMALNTAFDEQGVLEHSQSIHSYGKGISPSEVVDVLTRAIANFLVAQAQDDDDPVGEAILTLYPSVLQSMARSMAEATAREEIILGDSDLNLLLADPESPPS